VLDVTQEDGPFDAVLSVHALHHVGDPAAVLPHVRSLLAPGGRLVVADIIDLGAWSNRSFHIERVVNSVRTVYWLAADGDAAADVLRLLLHPRWLRLTRTDVPPTRDAFHTAYEEVFPGVVLTDDLHPMMCGAVWCAPS
jgi:SAM-dependent methyltransferase